jgi:hypothetical protein
VAKGQGGVISISLSAAASLDQASSLEIASLEAAAMLSPRHPTNRCVLLIGPGQLLLCALDGAGSQELLTEAAAVQSARFNRNVAANVTPIDSSLQLQDRVRKMLATVNAPRTDAIDRVH